MHAGSSQPTTKTYVCVCVYLIIFLEEGMDAVCECIAQYDLCAEDCSAYPSVVPQDDAKCFGAFVTLVCEEGVPGTFFQTAYSEMCPRQCRGIMLASI